MTGLALRCSTAAAVLVLASTLTACSAGNPGNAPVTPIPLASSWHAGLFVDGYGPQGLGPSMPANSETPDSKQITLSGLGLIDAEFSNGYSVQLLSGGNSLTKPTLHFCGVTYPSEQNRVSRWLVGVFDSMGNATGQISDAVAYDSAQSALAALGEIRAAIASCAPQTTVNTGSATLIADPRPSTDIVLTGAVPASHRAVMTEVVTEPSSGSSALIQTVWQVQGAYLVSLTFQHDANTPFTSDDQREFDSLASGIASRLTSAASSS